MNYKPYQPASAKELYFYGEPCAATGISPETLARWNKEKELINCQVCCYSYECPHRNRPERLPGDAGGKGQCRRLAEYHTPFSFQNVDGQIIEIPAHVIQAIREGA